jgi:hypothetical protein
MNKSILLSLFIVAGTGCRKDPDVVNVHKDELPTTLESQLRGNWTPDYAHYSFEFEFDIGLGIPLPYTISGINNNPNGELLILREDRFMDHSLSFPLTIDFGFGGGFPVPFSMRGYGNYEILPGNRIRVHENSGDRLFHVLSHGPFHLTLATTHPTNIAFVGEVEVDLIVNYIFEGE